MNISIPTQNHPKNPTRRQAAHGQAVEGDALAASLCDPRRQKSAGRWALDDVHHEHVEMVIV